MNKVYVLALLACLGGGLVEGKRSSDCFRESSDFCDFCCPEKKVLVCDQDLCKPIPITEPLTINEGGCYCLANDIDGQIIIDADHVKISLNNKLINGNSGDAAIKSTGPFKDIMIIDGAIKNPEGTGIQLSNCNNVTLRNLVIHPVNIAIDLKDCLHSTLSQIKANHNTNVTKAVIFLDRCDNSILEDIETSNCTKTRAVNVADDEGIISVLRSNNVTLRRFKADSCELTDRFDFYVVNFFESDNSTVEDGEMNNISYDQPISHTGIIAGFRSTSTGTILSMRRCQVNGGQVKSIELVRGFLIELKNVFLTDCQSSGFRVIFDQNEEPLFHGFSLSNVENAVLERCQSNDHHTAIEVIGFNIQGALDVNKAALENNSLTMKSCISQSLEGNLDVDESDVCGFDIGQFSQVVLEGCQSSGHRGFTVNGFNIIGARDLNGALENSLTMKSCISQSLVGNSDSSFVRGFDINQFSQVMLEECQSSGHEGLDVRGFNIRGAQERNSAALENSLTMKSCISQSLAGNISDDGSEVFGFDIAQFPQVLLEKCQSSGHEGFDARGFAIKGAQDEKDDALEDNSLTMKCCISQSLVGNLENSSSNANGFDISEFSQVVLEECQSSGHEGPVVRGFFIIGAEDENEDALKNNSLTIKCCISQALKGTDPGEDDDFEACGFLLTQFSQVVLEKCQSSGHEGFNVDGFSIIGAQKMNEAALKNNSLTMKGCISQALKGDTSDGDSDVFGFTINQFSQVVLEECQSSGHEGFITRGFNAFGASEDLLTPLANNSLTMKCCISQSLQGTTSDDESEAFGFGIAQFSQVVLEECQSSGHEGFKVSGFFILNAFIGFFVGLESSLTMKSCISQSLVGVISDLGVSGFGIGGFLRVVLEKCQSSDHKGFGVGGFTILGSPGIGPDPIINEVIMRECISQSLEGNLIESSGFARGFIFLDVNRILLEKCQSNGHTATEVRGFDFRGDVLNFDPPIINDLTVKWCTSQSLIGKFTDSDGSAIGFDTFTDDTLIFDHILFEGCQSNGHRGFKAIGYDLQAKDTIIMKNSSSSSCEGNLENSAGRAIGFNSVHSGIDPNVSFEGCQSHEHSGYEAFGFNVEYSQGERGNVLFKECLSNNLVGSFIGVNPIGLATGFNINVVKTARLEWCQSRCNTAFDARGITLGMVDESFTCLKCVASEHTKSGGGFGCGFVITSTAKGSIEQCIAKSNSTRGYSFTVLVTNVNLDDNLAQGNGTDGFRFDAGGTFSGIVSRRNKALANGVNGFFATPAGGSFTGGDWIDNYARGNGTDYAVTPPIQIFTRTAAGLKGFVVGDPTFEAGITNIRGI